MKIIQPAKFCATPVAEYADRMQEIQQPAEIEIGGIRLLSKSPSSAAEAMRINVALEKVEAFYSQ